LLPHAGKDLDDAGMTAVDAGSADAPDAAVGEASSGIDGA
jgi:hypothetical protein